MEKPYTKFEIFHTKVTKIGSKNIGKKLIWCVTQNSERKKAVKLTINVVELTNNFSIS